jgi:hypothetical protein
MLFDVVADPNETKNLIESPDHKAVREPFAEQAQKFLTKGRR